jgi:hypothetical protein
VSTGIHVPRPNHCQLLQKDAVPWSYSSSSADEMAIAQREKFEKGIRLKGMYKPRNILNNAQENHLGNNHTKLK